MNKYILGLGDVTHDCSVALAKKGEVIAAIEEERLTRIKHGFNLDDSTYSIENQGQYIHDVLKQNTLRKREEKLSDLIQYSLQSREIDHSEIDLMVTSSLYKESAFVFDSVYIQHHVAHAASAYYASPFDEAAIFVFDGYGDLKHQQSEHGVVAYGVDNKIKILDSFKGSFSLTETEVAQKIVPSHMIFKNSLGVFYQNITILLGFGYFNEGITMGLSSYGKYDERCNFIDPFISLDPGGNFQIDNRNIFLATQEYLSPYINDKKRDHFEVYANIAFKFQSTLEKIVFHVLNNRQLSSTKNLSLAGGVFMNSLLNGKIKEYTSYENIFIQPAAGDNGISIGCALYGSHMLAGLPKFYNYANDFNVYQGRLYDEDEITKVLNKYKSQLVIDKLTYSFVAKELNEGKIFGIFQGRSEIGARALGNRSIIASPCIQHNKQHINNIKRRANFRPLAPVVIEDKASHYFDNVDNQRYMTSVVKVKKQYIDKIPAAVHVDNTARLQTVNKGQNFILYSIIEEFEKVSGVPILLNTSFNIHSPIVEHPEEAIIIFLNSDIDYLIVNSMVINKNNLTK